MNRERLLDLLANFHDARVLVLGDVMLDRFVYGSVARISPEAPVPVMRVTSEVDMPGGAANVVRNIATLGAQSTLVGVVGEDAQAERLRTQLSALPTVHFCLVSDPARRTTTKMRFVAERQHVLRVDTEDRDALSDLTAKRVQQQFEQALEHVDIVILSDYAKGVLSPELTAAAIAAARRAHRPVIVDPKSTSLAKYAGATVLTPNRHELESACGHECTSDDQIVDGARRTLTAGICEAVVVTRGKEGMTVVTRDGPATHLRSMAREVFDVSGAGDTAIAVLALGLAAGADLTAAVHVANLAAGLVVAKPGTAVTSTGEIAATLTQFDEPQDGGKLFALDHVRQLVDNWRSLGLRVAFTNGCFDLLHPGHVSLLQQARRSADRLIVGLNSDLSVRRLKGEGRPAQSEVARATVLASLKFVDAVVIFSEDTPLALIDALGPDVLVKGADYTVPEVVGADVVMRRGGTVVLADFVAGHSTTGTLARLRAQGA
jgi:D-beta-D-heptose 7-phosphate kinase / D-beta-D-heptose 1-phosphate adenosyltransferase